MQVKRVKMIDFDQKEWLLIQLLLHMIRRWWLSQLNSSSVYKKSLDSYLKEGS